MTTAKRPATLSRRSSRLFLIVFLGSLAGLSWLLTKGNESWLKSLRHAGSSERAFHKCVEVVSGDSIRVIPSAKDGDSDFKVMIKTMKAFFKGTKADIKLPSVEPRLVRIIGIQAPPLQAGSNATVFADATGISPSALFEPRSYTSGKTLGEISRDALVIWAYKQDCLIEYPDTNRTDVAHVTIAGIDVGKKLLKEGQAVAISTPGPTNKYTKLYESFEQIGRDKNIGIWK